MEIWWAECNLDDGTTDSLGVFSTREGAQAACLRYWEWVMEGSGGEVGLMWKSPDYMIACPDEAYTFSAINYVVDENIELPGLDVS